MTETRSVLGVIPARLNSTRLPRKMLAQINGKPLIYYTWQQAKMANSLDELIVASDSPEIFDAVVQFGGRAVMTSPDCQSGSDRVAEVVSQFPGAQIIVNIQGDEPVLSPEAIDAAVKSLQNDSLAQVATVASPCSSDEEIDDAMNAKVVIDRQGNALYFSRSRIPYPRHPVSSYLKQIGLYAFRRNFLLSFRKLEQTFLEKAESLEQLRILEHGYKIKVAVGNFRSIGVDTQSDFERVSLLIKQNNRQK